MTFPTAAGSTVDTAKFTFVAQEFNRRAETIEKTKRSAFFLKGADSIWFIGLGLGDLSNNDDNLLSAYDFVNY
ncbi:MAG: hypothetical protein M3N30_01420 [Bacteroidota bacterium]|nr:hypothetical protein [Bacteroidota bacterium]